VVVSTAECPAGGLVVFDPTEVGSYTGAASPSGTFDQGGNLTEWNEAIVSGSRRGARGSSLADSPGDLGASLAGDLDPSFYYVIVGFASRVLFRNQLCRP